jgi:hypothetical protein
MKRHSQDLIACLETLRVQRKQGHAAQRAELKRKKQAVIREATSSIAMQRNLSQGEGSGLAAPSSSSSVAAALDFQTPTLTKNCKHAAD